MEEAKLVQNIHWTLESSFHKILHKVQKSAEAFLAEGRHSFCLSKDDSLKREEKHANEMVAVQCYNIAQISNCPGSAERVSLARDQKYRWPDTHSPGN